MRLRRDTLETLYVQLADALERDIACGIYFAFDRLPSEQELMAKYEVSRVTVRQAIALLHKKGLIDVKQGKGTFVATHTEETASDFRFLRIRRNDGQPEYPGRRLVDLRRAKANAEIARRLAIKTGDGVFILRRILEYARRPAVLDEITLPATLFSGLTRARYEAYRGSTYGFFETAFGVRMLRAEERLHAVAADPATAELLRIAPGTPLLAVDRVTFTYGDRPVEVRRGLCTTRHEHYWNTLT